MSRQRWRRDDGAVAVVWAIVLSLLVAPLTGLALTTYVRTGVSAELQRAADAGALAGAASIPLGDLNYLAAYLAATNLGPTTAVGTTLATYLPPGAANPLTVACAHAVQSLAVDNGFSGKWAAPHGAPTCSARYLPDSSLGATLGGCLTNLLSPVAPLLGGLTVPDVTRLLPALAHPGVEVTVTYKARGPMDELVDPAGTPSTHTVVSRAVRRFKDLVVVPTVAPNKIPLIGGLLGPVLVPATIDLNPTVNAVSTTLYTTLSTTSTLLNPLLSVLGCSGILTGLADDLHDLNPNTSSQPPPTAAQIIADARAMQTPLLALRMPADPTNLLKVPFLDFVPMCVNPTGSLTAVPLPTTLPAAGSLATCSAAAVGAFRASLVSS